MGTRDLLVKIIGDPKSAVDAFDRLSREADSTSSRVAKAGKVAAVAFAAIGTAAVAFGTQSVRAFQSTASAIDDLQDITGEGAEAMSRMRYAFESWGVSDEALTVGLRTLTKAVGSNNDAFAQYGIQVRDVTGRALPLSQILANTSDVFARLPDGVDKSNLALTLFGKRGLELLDVLNEGSAGLSELGAEADRFGLTLDDAAVRAQQANAKMGRQMSAAWKGLQVQVGQYLLPIVTKLTIWLGEQLPGAIAFVRSAVQRLTPAFEVAVAVITTVFEVVRGLVDWLADHHEILIGISVTIGSMLVAAFVSWAIAAGTAAVATIAAVAPLIAVGVAIAALVAGIVWLIEHFDAVKRVAGEVWDWIADKVTSAVNIAMVPVHAIADAAANVWGSLVETTRRVWDTVTSIVRSVVSTIGSVVNGLWNGIKSALSTAINGAIDVANRLIDGANLINPFDDIPRIKHVSLHTGGIVPGLPGQEVLVRAQAGEQLIGTRSAQPSPGDLGNSSGGLQVINNFHGITDMDSLTRAQARELGWMLRVA